MLAAAFPHMGWEQPQLQHVAIYTTPTYMNQRFAEDLAEKMHTAAERDRLPDAPFLERALRPPLAYFETDDPAFAGVCCVCHKKGCLGRCPRASAVS